MPNTNSKNITRIFIHGTLLALLLSAPAVAQDDQSATRERQAAQLRVAVEAQIARLDAEYSTRADQLRRQFNDRSRELQENAESEIELSNSMAAIGRVYQDSLAALQREINGRRNNVYAAQTEANDELIAGGEISPETWAQISSTPLPDYPFEPASTVSATAVEPDVVEEILPVEEEEVAAASATVAAAPAPQASGCEIGWYPDRDRDLFGDADAAATLACYPGKPSGFVDNDYDCDDSDATINPITGHCGPGP